MGHKDTLCGELKEGRGGRKGEIEQERGREGGGIRERKWEGREGKAIRPRSKKAEQIDIGE